MRPDRIVARALAALAALICVAFTATAEARRINVWYDPGHRPVQFTDRDVIAGIQGVLREWEQGSSNGVVLQWRGIPSPGWWPPADNSNIVIYYDPNMEVTACVEVCRFGSGCAASGMGAGRIRLNEAVNFAIFGDTGLVYSAENRNTPLWNTRGPSTCSQRASLMHAFGHLLLDDPNHPFNSVLQYPINSMSGRHLWESDRFLSSEWFGVQGRGLMMETVDRANLAVTTTMVSHAVSPSLPEAVDTPAGLGMGDGNGGIDNYAAVYGLRHQDGALVTRGIQFLKGDGRTWTTARQILCSGPSCANRAATSHRPCVVSSGSGLDYYMVWVDAAQFNSWNSVNIHNGMRAILYAESHDRGLTWSAPAAIAGAFTRSGVSCSRDRALDNVVIAFSGAAEDGIWLADRPAASVGNTWFPPRQIADNEGGGATPAPATADAPYIAFDQFSTLSTSFGMLAWNDDNTLTVKSASLGFNPSLGYVAISPPSSLEDTPVGTVTTSELLRSGPVINYEGVPVVGYSLNTDFEQQMQLWQNLYVFPYSVARVDNAYTYVAPLGALRRYTGAASNRTFPETAFLATTFTNPD